MTLLGESQELHPLAVGIALALQQCLLVPQYIRWATITLLSTSKLLASFKDLHPAQLIAFSCSMSYALGLTSQPEQQPLPISGRED